MATHIDVLVGNYEACVRWNSKAIEADQKTTGPCPDTSSFYFGYVAHNYHMLVYGCILGGMETKGMEIATKLNGYLFEDVFVKNPDLTSYLESYAALDIHVLVRFGRWRDILDIVAPLSPQLMLYRSAILHYARALAYANLGDLHSANIEADSFDVLRSDPSAKGRFLHNNTVVDLLAVDAPMIRGEIAYHSGKYDEAFILLRNSVALQDGLNYDEPWGKMQPIRHALGGLLLERGHVVEAEEVFRTDLHFHPNNPWGLIGLIECLKRRLGSKFCYSSDGASKLSLSEITTRELTSEFEEYQSQFVAQRKSEWADFIIRKACTCCHFNKVMELDG